MNAPSSPAGDGVAVKICGLNTAEAVDAAVAGGAAWLGFILHPRSPRAVSPAEAGALARRADGRARSVAVLVDPDDVLLARVLTEMRPDVIQLHGEESPLRCRDARNYAEREVWKAFGVAEAADIAASDAYAARVDRFVFDARPPAGADRPGGWGVSYDWSLLKAARPLRPWLLSGGLAPETVADAVAASGARALDVASGVESAPGVKDPARIAAFLAAARAAAPADAAPEPEAGTP